MIGRLFILICCLLIDVSASAIAQTTDISVSDSKRPALDISTPESTLKSYWAFKEWYNAKRLSEIRQKFEEYSQKEELDSMIPLTTGDMKRYFKSFKPMSPTVLERNIQGIFMASPSRAIITVIIKNVTPVPDGTVPSPLDIEERKNGHEFRYVLLKESDGWRISEVWRASTGFMPASQLYEPRPPLYPSFVHFD